MTTNDRGFALSIATSHYIYGRYDGVRIRIDVTDSCNVSPKIFAYRMMPTNPATGDQEGHFSHICSTVDLAEYPEDEPLSTAVPPWFRLAYVDVLVRSWSEAHDFIDKVQADVVSLWDSLNAMDNIAETEEITVGTLCPDESESSESSESSSSSSSAGPVVIDTLTVSPTFFHTAGAGVAWVDGLVELPGGTNSQVLFMQGCDCSALPSNATILGIEISPSLRHVNAASSSSSSSSSSSADASQDGCPELLYATIHHPDDGMGDDALTSQCITGPSFSNYAYGDDETLWGKTWDVADFQRGEFGIALVVRADSIPTDVTVEADLDTSTITITYSVPE